MPLDANFAHNSQPSGRDDQGNPTWLGQNLPALLIAARDFAVQRDQEEGGTEHTSALLAILSHHTALLSGLVYRSENRILRNTPRLGWRAEVELGVRKPAGVRTSICAHIRTLSMGSTPDAAGRGFGMPCALPIVQHAPDLPWVHARNTPEAAEAGRDHAAVYANDCNLCPPGTPFWSDSAYHLQQHTDEFHSEPDLLTACARCGEALDDEGCDDSSTHVCRPDQEGGDQP